MLKDSPLYSIAFNKCPRCHQGDFFVTKSAFSRRFDEMHTDCPHCGEPLTPEPGFYWGAMFVSYAFYTIYTLLTFFVFVQWLKVDLDYYLIGLTPTLVLLTPYFFRLARRSWLTIFTSYDPNKQRVQIKNT
ncbi:DUF983 domain-containing protein [Tellurirhabdus bombi]|uniref:DUF983 domain-containing protein n=1 Tax=Tellurirhabdus bombi TaxID=2907205 RepID=UPI001F32A1C9|nr:DUF983 domain-containing protein [Tellurirhabdus bombi]